MFLLSKNIPRTVFDEINLDCFYFTVRALEWSEGLMRPNKNILPPPPFTPIQSIYLGSLQLFLRLPSKFQADNPILKP